MRFISRLLLACLVFASLIFAPDYAQAKTKKPKAGSVRVYRFDNLDVEGNVKTPQLMYFLKRIRKRFRSFRLPKQNFSNKILKAKEEADFL
ncbi:MAG: hypothetical protein JRF33_01350 [Deltaproteobacteria bacterium]|nr:hypothetical protein [Deltaproteobacteria bacterium]